MTTPYTTSQMTTLQILYTYIPHDNVPDDTPLVNILDDNLQHKNPDDNPTDTVQYIRLEKIPDDHPLDNILDDDPHILYVPKDNTPDDNPQDNIPYDN